MLTFRFLEVYSNKLSTKPIVDPTVKQIEMFNDNLHKAKGKFFVSITYDVDLKNTYYDNYIYQAIDLSITKIVRPINTGVKFFEVKTPRNENFGIQRLMMLNQNVIIVLVLRKALRRVRSTLE
jgi:hypothetical protein